ncbi:DNA-binding transcriptional regulator, AcrR family [Gillisia sp. Hel1_33_143]|uniref:TetR/AcrR family transcriptional regulator n=1 Tax=Gillisia sp. Hel1_33_143 TaxID=1336796 RepID=UPI00087CC0BA|nr:TetR family transcriptional regulator [Gillisia sp. Hel1_33_143]SDS25865.1 DNA-binding transcriptional regulator, AcrR family [Gillisia sp. Hel1_33_143]
MELNDKQIQIITEAEKLFAENGFAGTSVRQIAKEAGVNVAMISYYFGSKERLLEAMLIYRSADFRMELDTVLSIENSTLEKVDEVVALIIRRVHHNRRMYKIIHFEYSNDTRKIDFKNYINQKLSNYKVIEEFVIKGQKEGVFSKDLNIPLTVPTILGTYFNFYYNLRFFEVLHNITDEASLDNYVHTTLTQHIQKTIKALLTYEN